MALRKDRIVDKDLAVVVAAQNMMLRPIERVTHEELAVGRPTDHFNFQERNPTTLSQRLALLLIGDVEEGGRCLLVEAVHKADEEEGRANVDDLVVSEHIRLPTLAMVDAHVGTKPPSQVLDAVIHRIGVETDLDLLTAVAILFLQ